MEQANHTRIVRGQSAGEQDAVGETRTVDLLTDPLTVGFIGAGAGQYQHGSWVAPEKLGGLVHEPTLVLYGIDSPETEEDLAVGNLREGLQRGVTLIGAINFEGHSVWLDQHTFVRELFLQ